MMVIECGALDFWSLPATGAALLQVIKVADMPMVRLVGEVRAGAEMPKGTKTCLTGAGEQQR